MFRLDLVIFMSILYEDMHAFRLVCGRKFVKCLSMGNVAEENCKFKSNALFVQFVYKVFCKPRCVCVCDVLIEAAF